MKTLLALCTALLLLCEIGNAQTLPRPQTDRILITTDVPAKASIQLAGRGVKLSERLQSPPRTVGMAEIVWHEVDRRTDPRGGTHVSYRQFLVEQGRKTELVGSEVLLHYTNAGTLWAINGAQFTSVVPGNEPRFSAADAVDRALLRIIAVDARFRPVSWVNLDPSARAHRVSRTELKVVQTNDGFRYAFFTFANAANGVYYSVVIDAETEEILQISEVNPRSNCAPTAGGQAVAAEGHPVRDDLRNAGVRRSVNALTTTNRPSPFTHEGHWNNGPAMSVWQETNTQAFKCNQSAATSYTLFPLLADGGLVSYRFRTNHPEWNGYAAGDAIHHTNETMRAFADLGRNGWDGAGGDANVIIESTRFGGADYAYFLIDSGGDQRLPPGPVLGIAPADRMYNASASLDHIGYEWGHGVIHTTANFPYSGTGAELHEGFADVIGHAVEKLRQSWGSGVEQSADWHMHEDTATSGYARSGEVDDGSGHTWTGPNGSHSFNDRLHKDDNDFGLSAHDTGNMLSVVFYVLSDGEYNPICNRITVMGCGQNVPGLGFHTTAQIMFDAIQFYLPSNSTWEYLADYVSMAAFDLYNDCPFYAADSEQDAVNLAFNAIGYPRIAAPISCP